MRTVTRARAFGACKRAASRRAVALSILALAVILPACVGGQGADVSVSEHESTGEPSAPSEATTAAPVTAAPTTAIDITVIPTTHSAETTISTSPVVVVNLTGPAEGPTLLIELAVESRVPDVSQQQLSLFVFETLLDPRGWTASGFRFVENPQSSLRLVLAEGAVVDELCMPLQTRGTVSCQNGPTVALNATRWREATDSWDSTVEEYRTYLVNHEVGHLIGQRHPTPRCPVSGAPAAVMEQQTKSLEGCVGNGWPRPWEHDYAALRPAMIGPDPSWGPDPIPANLE